MIKIFSPTDKVFSSNGDTVIKATRAVVHKTDNGDYYLELECGLEYIDYIKTYTMDTYVLTIDEGTMSQMEYDPELEVDYMIYYVPSEGETTEIIVPGGKEDKTEDKKEEQKDNTKKKYVCPVCFYSVEAEENPGKCIICGADMVEEKK